MAHRLEPKATNQAKVRARAQVYPHEWDLVPWWTGPLARLNGGVFVEAELVVDLPLQAAKESFGRAVADGGLVAESRRAVDDGLVFVMPVGPRGSHGPAKEVVVRMLPGRHGPQSLVIPLRWEVAGPAGRLFPALDANLGLAAQGPESSRLWVVGRYEPPLGRLGATIDRAGMSRVASATMTAFLREVAAQLLSSRRPSGSGAEAGTPQPVPKARHASDGGAPQSPPYIGARAALGD